MTDDARTPPARIQSFVPWVVGGYALVANALAQPSDTQALAARAEPLPLRAAQTSVVTQRGGEEIIYVIDAEPGRRYLLDVEQRGLDLIVVLTAPDGTSESFNAPLLRDEHEYILLENSATGSYTVALRAEEHTGAVGGHAIRMQEVTTAPAAELEAWRSMTRGAAANLAGGDERWIAASDDYRAAADRWATLGRTREQTEALYASAMVDYWQLYRWESSAALAGTVAEMYADLQEPRLAANAVHLQAAALVEQALETRASSEQSADVLFDEALTLLEQARAMHERMGNLYDLGLVLNNFGYTYYNRGAFDSARPYWEQSAVLMRDLSEWTGELNPLSNIAAVDAEEGNIASAIDAFERVVNILPAGAAERYRSATLDNLGVSHLMFGNAEQSLQAFSAALSIQTQLDDFQGRGRSLRGIGRTYYAIGELDLARTYLHEALPVARDTNDGRNQEGILRDLGNIAFLEQDYSAALDFHREALDIVNSASDRIYLELLVVKDLIALGRYTEADEIAADAKVRAEQIGSELLLAEALHQVGRTRLHTGVGAAAVADLEQAAQIYATLGLEAQHAETLHSLAVAARDEGRIDAAIEYGEASLDRLEQLRLRVVDPELRAYFSASRRAYYETQISLQVEASPLDALDTSERGRARMIADLLEEASIDLGNDTDPAIVERRTTLYAELAERNFQRDKLLEAGAERDAARRSQLLADIARIKNELNLLEIEIRRASPALASLNPPEPLVSGQIQALLDEDSVLLQYALGEEASYVWAVTHDAVTVARLADRQVIEAAARRALEGLQRHAPSQAARATLAEDLAALTELVLTPIAAELNKQRIVLSLDGALQYVPFAVLPMPDVAQGTRVLASHEIVNVPSMSAVAALRRRDAVDVAPKTLAIFADPVVGARDVRLNGRALAAAVTPGRGSARGPDTGPGTTAPVLERLQATAFEADSIAALVASEQRFVAKGFNASRDAIVGGDLRQYRYLHFATHGLVDTRYPALSALALSQFDEQGAPQDGLLRLHDIYGLKLNADLVVLSACETGLGREVRGEGLLGLSQGFMYAGARGVLASLWQVPDRATAALMERFYEFMLDDGLDPAAALKEAQLASAAERRWSDPYFWGGFVLLGDWQ